MRDVLLKQLGAMEAQLDLLKVMCVGLRQTLNAPRAEEAELLPGCVEHAEEDCGRRNGEACQAFRTGQRMCRGCGLDPVTGEAAKK